MPIRKGIWIKSDFT